MGKVIILLYHQLSKDNAIDKEKLQESCQLYTRRENQFIADMEYLKKSGCQIISLYDLAKIKNRKKTPIKNGVVITFDDGEESNYDIAFSILKKYGFKATFFIIADKVGREGYMNWDEIREIANYKNKKNERLFNIESHSHTHSALARKKEGEEDNYYKERVLWELKTSREIINKEIKIMPKFLALPGGSGGGDEENDKLVRELAKQCRYWGIRTSNKGIINPSSNIYKLPVFPILNRTNIKAIKIWLEYSFLIFPWKVINKVKALLKI